MNPADHLTDDVEPIIDEQAPLGEEDADLDLDSAPSSAGDSDE